MAGLAGSAQPRVPSTVRAILDARARSLGEMSTAPGTLGAAVAAKFDKRVAAEYARLGVEAPADDLTHA